MSRPRKTTPGETVLEIKHVRSTGAHVCVEYLPWADESQPWQTTCYTHGGVCSHETRTLAESFARVPEEWCEDCQAQYSTDGKGSWDDFSDQWE